MSREALPTGAQFRSQVVVMMTLFSLPTLLAVGALGWTLLRLTPDMWWSLIGAIGLYALVASPLNHMALVRLMGPISEWLDGAEGRLAAERGYVAMMHFPGRIAAAAALGWLVPTALVSIALTWRYPAAWGSWESLVLLCGGASAGAASAILMTYQTRAGVFARVRNALASAVGGPDRRGQLAPHVSMRTKTLATVSLVAIVPVLLATLIGARQAEGSLERFALGWTDLVLASLPSEGSAEGAVRGLREELVSTPMPVSVSLQPLERFESGLAEVVREDIRGATERGARQGDSAHLPSAQVFSWRVLDDGSVWVAWVNRDELLAHGTVSGFALGALLLVSLGFALGAAWLLARDITEPAAILREAADRLALGDLRIHHLYESSDELGELSRSFEIMGVSLGLTIGALAESADDVERQAGELAPVCRNLSSATTEQVEGTRRAAESMEEIRAQVKGIAESSQALAVSIEESSSSVLELGATGQELNETASVLNSKVEEVSASIEQMAAAVKQTSRNTETLASAVEQNSASMEQMASSLRQVDSAAEEAAQLSRSVVERSEIGRAKVRETIEGMEAIREATDTVEEVIRTLHGRAGEIGAVVDVIDSVADETNLLALNAAIIAAQSGEHGRAFGVVADEIKDLAERVLSSTKEIGALIQSVQEESGRARGAIERGSASVASGVDLSAEAGLALEEITSASRRSGERIDAIVSALREQAKAAGHVVELMESVSDGVEEIRRAALEQDRGNEVVSSSAVTMREVAQQVRGATEEQSRGAGRIRDSVESVRLAIEQINQALQEQTGACESAASYLEEVQGRSATHEEATTTVEGVVRELRTRSQALRTEVGRFQT